MEVAECDDEVPDETPEADAINRVIMAAIMKKLTTDPVETSDKREYSKSEVLSFANAYSKQYGVPLAIVQAVMEQESNFQHTVFKNGEWVINTSTAGAVGVMQVVPKSNTAGEDCLNNGVISRYSDLGVLEKNIQCGVWYLRNRYIALFDGVSYNDKFYTGWQAALRGYVGVGENIHVAYVEEVSAKCQFYNACPIPA